MIESLAFTFIFGQSEEEMINMTFGIGFCGLIGLDYF